MAGRFSCEGAPYEGFVRKTKQGYRWTSKVVLVEKHLRDPLTWKKPQRIFVNSMSDLFHEKLPTEEIARVFAIMSLAERHQFQVLTKRAERMRELSNDSKFSQLVLQMAATISKKEEMQIQFWPLPNVWLGVSVEDQERADERIPHLLNTKAKIRFLSVEPLLERVDISRYLPPWGPAVAGRPDQSIINWAIVGAESGPGARKMDLDWVRDLRDQCSDAEVAFFFKQSSTPEGKIVSLPVLDGRQHKEYPQ
jgi:protein gp37